MVMRIEKDQLIDVTSGIDLKHGIITARAGLPGIFIIVGKD
jgi:hypothetical protein